MVRFAVEVLSLANVEPHPNADRLELAVVGNYRVIVGKNAFRPGDLVAYIPEGALLPDRLIEELGIRGYLAGSQHNRVKAAKLRGVLSQGLVYGAHSPNGKPVQDLTYNSAFGLRLVVFDIAIDGRFLEYEDALERAAQMGLPAVPLLYHGPFDAVQVLALAEGRETLTGLHANIREGIVIRPEHMRVADEIGRIVLKHVGSGYLTRTGTHLTEYT
jgi:tRNA-binding EMAP/Myf-like protein